MPLVAFNLLGLVGSFRHTWVRLLDFALISLMSALTIPSVYSLVKAPNQKLLSTHHQQFMNTRSILRQFTNPEIKVIKRALVWTANNPI